MDPQIITSSGNPAAAQAGMLAEGALGSSEVIGAEIVGGEIVAAEVAAPIIIGETAAPAVLTGAGGGALIAEESMLGPIGWVAAGGTALYFGYRYLSGPSDKPEPAKIEEPCPKGKLDAPGQNDSMSEQKDPDEDQAERKAPGQNEGESMAPGADDGKGDLSTATDDPRYQRPSSFRKGVRQEAWDNAKGLDGKVRDPLTNEEMNFDDPWDMGHKPGYEFRKHQESALRRDISRGEFLDEHNNPEHYQPELPSSNRSHKGESKTGDWLGE